MIESLTTFKPVVATVALALMWLIEGLIPMFEGRRERIRHDASNVALGILNALVAALVFASATLVATEWAPRELLRHSALARGDGGCGDSCWASSSSTAGSTSGTG